MNVWGWIFVVLTVLAALLGLVRLAREVNRRIAAGTIQPKHRLPVLFIGAVVGLVFVVVSLKIASVVTAGFY